MLTKMNFSEVFSFIWLLHFIAFAFCFVRLTTDNFISTLITEKVNDYCHFFPVKPGSRVYANMCGELYSLICLLLSFFLPKINFFFLPIFLDFFFPQKSIFLCGALLGTDCVL
nr:hypothetical protein Itr_chr13CG05050 [Ipomoea trifida]